MAGYIYMKILESQPERYDIGIALLSLGQAPAVKKAIAKEFGREGLKALEIGVGTAELASQLARRGASVVGFDQSSAMLGVAKAKVERLGLGDKIKLMELGVAEMDNAFEDQSFDLVASTLVFSELTSDEQSYALEEAFRVLKPGGHLALADEVKPNSLFKRIAYGLLRAPLLIITFALTQTTTRAVEGLPDKVKAAGFILDRAALSALGSFMVVKARKPGGENG